MEKEIMSPELDGGIDKETAEMYRKLLHEISDICNEAHAHLHLFDTRPECASLILEDYIEKIEEVIRV